MTDKILTSISAKVFDKIYEKATDRDGFTEADRREISDLGRTKPERAKIYRALDIFVDLIVTKRELGKFARQLKLDANARSHLMGIVGHDGMSLVRKRFTDNPGIAHAKLVDPKTSAKVRAAAAAHIGKGNDPAALQILTNALKTERNWFVRFSIAKALISVDSRTRKRPDIITILVTAYRKGGSRVRAYALNKLRDVQTRAVTDIFIDASKHRNPVVRGASIRVLAKNSDPKAKVALLKALKDKDEGVRAAVPRWLKTQVTRATSLIKLLKSPKTRPADRGYLIKKLSQIKEPVAQIVVAGLVKLIEDRDIGLRFAAAKVLGSFRGKKVSDAFIPLLEDRNEKLRLMAVKYFSKIGDIRGLTAVLSNRDGGIRFRAIEGFEKVTKPLPISVLIKALDDKLEIIRIRAARLIAKRARTSDLRLLAARLKKERCYSIKELLVSSVEKLTHKLLNKYSTPALQTALAHSSPIVRRHAAELLGTRGDMFTVSILHKRINKEPNADVKRRLEQSIEVLAAKHLKTYSVPALQTALAHSSPIVRRHAAELLGTRGDMSTISNLDARLKNEPDENVKMYIDEAIKSLATKLLQNAPVSKLLKALAHPTATIRLFAARFLRKRKDVSVVPTLIARFKKEPDAGVRTEIVRTLASISTENVAITTALIKATEDPSPTVRERAVWSFGQRTDSRIEPVLIKLTEDPDHDVRYAAVVQLDGSSGTKIVTVLIKLLRDPIANVQRAAIHSLISQWHSKRNSQKDRRKILSAIIAGSRSREKSLRLNALWALLRMKNQKAMQALAVALKHPDIETSRYADGLFLEIKTKRYSWAVPSLTGLLKNRSETIRYDAGMALCRIGTESALLAALTSSNTWVRTAAVRELGKKMYPNASRILVSLLDDPVLEVRVEAIWVLRDKRHPSIVPAIVKVLSHPKAAMRAAAIRILAYRKDPESVIALASAIKSDDPYVRKIATQSLLKDVKSLQTLLAVLMKPKHRLYGVVANLIKKYKQYYKPMLGKMLGGKWELEAATALEVIGDADSVTELLAALKRLPSDTEFQRIAAWSLVKIAVRALVRSNDPRVLPAFSKLLKERGSNIWPQVLRTLVRAKFPTTYKAFYYNYRNAFKKWDMAIRLVQGLDKPGNIRAITEYMESDIKHGFHSCFWIVKPLLKMNDVRAVPILLKALAKAPHEEVLKKALKHFVRPAAIPHFAAALKAEYYGLPQYDYAPNYEFTIKVLSAIGGARVTSILLGLLPPKRPWTSGIVHAAVEALGKTKDPRVEAKLIAIVKENGAPWDWNSLNLCPYIKALGELGSKKAVPLIIKGLKSFNDEMRGVAATVLGKIKDKRTIKALVERMLKDKKGSVRGLAARALGEIGDPRALSVLLRVSEKDTDEWVRKEALKALHKLPGQLIRAS